LQFGNPISPIGFWDTRIKATWQMVLMPEASMHKYDLPHWPENEIRLAGQTPLVKPKSMAQTVYQFSNKQLGPHTLRPNGGHVLTARCS
jgi:hypothetical protein